MASELLKYEMYFTAQFHMHEKERGREGTMSAQLCFDSLYLFYCKYDVLIHTLFKI